MSEPTPEASSRCSNTATRQDLRNQITLAGACLAWALTFVASLHLIREGLAPAGPVSWALAALPTLLAIPVLVIFLRFLRGTDELQRLIQLEAMALAFGGGFFVLCGYEIFEELGAPAADTLDLVVVLPVLYALGSLLGWWRYR